MVKDKTGIIYLYKGFKMNEFDKEIEKISSQIKEIEEEIEKWEEYNKIKNDITREEVKSLKKYLKKIKKIKGNYEK